MNADKALRQVFEWTCEDGSAGHHPTLRIRSVVAVQGRCVHVQLGDRYQSSGDPPTWADVAPCLFESGCESFRLEGWDLFAKMKTAEQLEADASALDYDLTQPFMDCTAWGDAEYEEPTAKSAPRGKWEKMLEEFIRESGATTFVRLAVLKNACDAFETDGKHTKVANLGREFKKLVARGVVTLVADDEYRLAEAA